MATTPQDDNPFSSPQSEEAAVTLGPTQVWRDGDLVVMAGDGELPRRCVKCGEVADGDPLERTEELSYANWIEVILGPVVILVSIVVGGAAELVISKLFPARRILWVFLVVAFLTWAVLSVLVQYWHNNRPRIVMKYSLCAIHRRHSSIAAAVFILSLVTASIVAAICSALGLQSHLVPLLILLVGLLAFGFIVLSRADAKTRVVKHESGRVWLSGFGKPFVDSLPPYPHAAERSSPAIIP